MTLVTERAVPGSDNQPGLVTGEGNWWRKNQEQDVENSGNQKPDFFFFQKIFSSNLAKIQALGSIEDRGEDA